jgi:hypothetical protein
MSRTSHRRSIAAALMAVAVGSIAALTATTPASAATDTRDKMVQIAQRELGDSSRNHMVNGDCNYYSGQAKGGQSGCPAGWAHGEYCADFAKYVWKNAGDVDFLNELDSWAYSFKNYGIKHGTFHAAGSGYQPKPGDAAVFEWNDGDGHVDHVGIVTANKNGRVTTIEGNSTGGMVQQHVKPGGIDGFIAPIIKGGDAGQLSSATGDLTGDGMSDVTVFGRDAASNAATFTFVANGNGFWETPIKQFDGSPALAQARMGTGSFTKDGRDDMVMASAAAGNPGVTNLMVWPSGADGKVGLNWTARAAIGITYDTAQIAVGDLTGDGLDDVTVYGRNSKNLGAAYTFVANGNGFWETPVQQYDNSGALANVKIKVGVVTKDNRQGLIIASADADRPTVTNLMVWPAGATAKTTPDWTPKAALGFAFNTVQIAAGDLTGDGLADVSIYGRDGNNLGGVYSFVGNGNGFWETPVKQFTGSGALANAKISVGAVNKDDRDDLIIASADGDRPNVTNIMVWRSSGTNGVVSADWAAKAAIGFPIDSVQLG